MNKLKKNNIVKFPEIKVSEQEKQIEAILFASNIPLDVETIQIPNPLLTLGISFADLNTLSPGLLSLLIYSITGLPS